MFIFFPNSFIYTLGYNLFSGVLSWVRYEVRVLVVYFSVARNYEAYEVRLNVWLDFVFRFNLAFVHHE